MEVENPNPLCAVFKAVKGVFMNYTQANWTVKSLYTDSTSTAKTMSLPDLTYSSDYAKSADEPNEAIITNTTGGEISPMESIRYGTSVVQNVYSGTNIDIACMPSMKKGVQTLVEINEIYRATNSVTGQEIDLPCKGRIVLRFPTHSCVTADLVKDLLYRTIAASLNKGSVDATRQVEVARGSLMPDGI